MKVQVLGPNCDKCNQLADWVGVAAGQLHMPIELIKVTDIAEIMKFGVMMTPALAIEGQVKIVGRVPDVDEIKRLLQSK